MKKLVILATALFLLLILPAAHAEEAQHPLHLMVEFDANIIMARYDIDLLINGAKVASIDHGDSLDAIFSVPEGMCTLTFQKSGSPDVRISTIIGVNTATTVDCEVHANLSSLKFRHITTNCTPNSYLLPEGGVLDLNGTHISVRSHRTVSEYRGQTPAEGKVYVICEVDFANRTSKDVSVVAILTTWSFDACCDDYELDALWTAMYGIGGDISFDNIVSALRNITQSSEVIHPGKIATIELLYEVPEDWKELEVYYGHKAIHGGEVAFVLQND